MRFYNRENLKNLVDEDFFKYYKRNRVKAINELSRKRYFLRHVHGLLKELNEMLVEANHGVHLNNFAVIVPKESIIEVNDGIFKKRQTVNNQYRLFFEDEFYSENYYFQFYRPPKKNKDRLRKPNPYSVILHRKKIKKNKLKDNGEDNS